VRHLAATYTAGIVRNHPFIDGNKRTGESAAQAILSLAAGTLDEPPSPPGSEPTLSVRDRLLYNAGRMTASYASGSWRKRKGDGRNTESVTGSGGSRSRDTRNKTTNYGYGRSMILHWNCGRRAISIPTWSTTAS